MLQDALLRTLSFRESVFRGDEFRIEKRAANRNQVICVFSMPCTLTDRRASSRKIHPTFKNSRQMKNCPACAVSFRFSPCDRVAVVA